MGRPRYTYSIDAYVLGMWRQIGGQRSRGEADGYIEAKREAPGPRCAHRAVRSDGLVVAHVYGTDDVTIGVCPDGGADAERFAWAAVRALQRAIYAGKRGTRAHHRPELPGRLEPIVAALRKALEEGVADDDP
jgi:hypothetical protein